MPKSIIDKVNRIGKREKQGREFLFSNRSRELFPWMDEVPIDNPNFQGLLKDEAPYPDVPEELPGVELEDVDGPRPAVEE